jgi:hypothetical protein
LSPSGWAWTIQPLFPGAPPRDLYQVNYGSGATQYMSQLTPAVSAPPVVTYLQKSANLADIGSASAARANLGLGTAIAADSLNSATTVVNVSAATAPSSGQVLTATGGAAATWQTPSGGSGGISPPAGDIGGTTGTPTVVGTHLATPLPVSQGGSGTASGAPQNGVFAGPPSGGAGAPSFRGLAAADVPTLNQNTTGIAGSAAGLQSATTTVAVSAATAPILGQVLTATGGAAATWQTQSSGFANPMTTLGDLIYENATPAPARLPGNTAAMRKYLTQAGTGGGSAPPGWNTILAADVPTLNQSTSGVAATATAAAGLQSTTSTVAVSSASAPTSGQVLTAIGSAAATWQTPSGGGGGGSAGLAPSGDSSGATDYTNIQALLTAGDLVVLQAGLFYVNAILSIPSNTWLAGAGMNVTTIRAVSGSWSSALQPADGTNLSGIAVLSAASSVTAAVNIKITDLTVDGNQAGITALPTSWSNPAWYCTSPLHMISVTGMVIDHVQVINSIGYGLYLENIAQYEITNSTILTGQSATWGLPSMTYGIPNQQDGLHMASVSFGKIDGNYIDSGALSGNVGDDAIALQSYTPGCNDITISNNRIRAAESGIDLALSGYDIWNITITGNDIWAAQNGGIITQPFIDSAAISRNITITGNTITNAVTSANANKAGIILADASLMSGTNRAGWQNVTITGNTIQGITFGWAIYTGYGSDVTIAGNTVVGYTGGSGSFNTHRAVHLGSDDGAWVTKNFTITGNVVDCSSDAGTGGNAPTGIFVAAATDGVISGNTVIGPAITSGSLGIRVLGDSPITGLVVNGNRVKSFQTAIFEDTGNGNGHNSYVGNNTYGCTNIISQSGTGNVAASNL